MLVIYLNYACDITSLFTKSHLVAHFCTFVSILQGLAFVKFCVVTTQKLGFLCGIYYQAIIVLYINIHPRVSYVWSSFSFLCQTHRKILKLYIQPTPNDVSLISKSTHWYLTQNHGLNSRYRYWLIVFNTNIPQMLAIWDPISADIINTVSGYLIRYCRYILKFADIWNHALNVL